MNNPSRFHYPPGAAVHVKIQGRKATFTPKRVRIEPGATVAWSFSGVPEGYQPILRFTTPIPFELLGQAGDRIVGIGAKAVEESSEAVEESTYKVALVSLLNCVIQCMSEQASICNVGGDPDPPTLIYNQ